MEKYKENKDLATERYEQWLDDVSASTINTHENNPHFIGIFHVSEINELKDLARELDICLSFETPVPTKTGKNIEPDLVYAFADSENNALSMKRVISDTDFEITKSEQRLVGALLIIFTVVFVVVGIITLFISH